MAGHYLRGRSRSAIWAWNLAAFAFALLPISVGFFRLHLLDQSILSLSLLLAGGIAALGLLLAVFAILIIWRSGARGGGRAVGALLVGGVAAAPFLGAAYLFTKYPDGHAAETTGMSAALSETAPATVSTLDGVLVGRDFQATAATVYQAARTAMEKSGMTIADVRTPDMARLDGPDLGVSGTVSVPIPTLRDSLNLDDEEEDDSSEPFADLDSDDYTIQAVGYAPLFAFPSDVTIRIVETDGTTYVDLRSVSRSLERDLGQNRRLIQDFLARLDEAMKVLEGVAPES
ncbi:DUF1499 domain-containing protein [Aureimonas sp. AU20]|uniref:DUF1499 domain-containing protein n=1 Tax=Aureimonas sp. AU20 TaxID=1349819 RepID=UPI0007223432|nr:DUF1499 domain-containing protein [Aureimonas sp. AU20]ALN73014.1 hypothetical protein M673_09815 [Aureimonas sp. AU20]